MGGKIDQCKPHAIMISVPFQGHINPTVNLALKLASKGLVVTFAHPEFVHDMLSKAQASNNSTSEVDMFSNLKDSGFDIRYTTISDGLPLEFDRSLHLEEYWTHLLTGFSVLVDEFIGKTIKSSDPSLIPFIVADTSYAWLPTIANKYNLVSVSFWTEPALVFSLCYHSELLKEHGHFPFKDGIEEDISYLPGVDTINTRDLMPYFKESEFDGTVSKTVFMIFEEVKKVDFVLHNTIQELETGTLTALNKVLPSYAVGPINFSNNLTTNVTNSLKSASDCTEWLSSKPPGSVLYVSFGSIVQTDSHVIQEIANGLLLSGVNFIWVMRPHLVRSDHTNPLPNGFEDEIRDRGLIAPWCDQIKVLSDPAIGGFLTHCGWNSILESIWCSVPMICYPVTFDQPTNRKLVVDDWKIGVNLCDGKSVEREKVAENITNFMLLTSSRGLKEKIKKVTETLHKAVEIAGSSDTNLDRFIVDLKAKINASN